MVTAHALDRGRESFGRRAWAEAYARLSAAERESPLEPEDLERLAMAAYLVGREVDSADRDASARERGSDTRRERTQLLHLVDVEQVT